MFAAAIYYYYIRGCDVEVKYKVSKGLLLVYLIYYIVYTCGFQDRLWEPWFWMLFVLDFFITGVLVMKSSHKKLTDVLSLQWFHLL